MENMKELVCNNFTRLFEQSDFKTYRALAQAVKINENTIQRWVNKKSYPELPNIEKLAEVFRVSPLEFYKTKVEPVNVLSFKKAIGRMLLVPEEVYELGSEMDEESWDIIIKMMKGRLSIIEAKKSRNSSQA
jgi:transcriptional regulator with XRE-family HTH domain